VALGSLGYEVRRPPCWDKVLVGLAFDIVALLVVIGAGAHLITPVVVQPLNGHRYIALLAPSPSRLESPTISATRSSSKLARVDKPAVVLPPVVRTERLQPPPIEAPRPEISVAAAA
jgi:hypothetical protein